MVFPAPARILRRRGWDSELFPPDVERSVSIGSAWSIRCASPSSHVCI